MNNEKAKPETIDEYIAQYPAQIQEVLEKIRATIQEAAPNATEAISYQMPTFKLKGNLVHFAAYKKHIGFYPRPSGIEKFQEEIASYKSGKGSLQFPLNREIPLALIAEIVKFRVGEDNDK